MESRSEQQHIHERSGLAGQKPGAHEMGALRPAGLIFQLELKQAAEELDRPTRSLLLSGLSAGFGIGISLAVSAARALHGLGFAGRSPLPWGPLMIEGVAMCLRVALVVLMSAWFGAAPGARAQVVDEENVQTVRAAAAGGEQRTPDQDEVTKLILRKINEFRQEQGLQGVKSNARLADAARSLASHMAETDRFGHTADGRRPADRARNQGYEYCIITENIAYEYSSAGFEAEELAENFVQGWLDSPGHRRNIVDSDVTETGVGIARSAETHHYYAVQMFGRPKSQSIEFQIANESPAVIQYQVNDQQFSLPPRYTRTHEQCRPSELVFQLPGGRTTTKTPASGDQFVVVREQGQVRVKEK